MLYKFYNTKVAQLEKETFHSKLTNQNGFK